MPLQLPNLDDRRYDDLVAEALMRIPGLSPEWTNHNPSDPGITLVELFAYLTDMLLYRQNRITEDNTWKFLKLLKGPDWTPPTADLHEEIRETVLGVRETYRAVTKEDYELLATQKFNQWLKMTQPSITPVARARCVPQRNLDGGADALQPRPEHVSVVIVPAAEASGNGAGALSPPSDDLVAALFSFLDPRRMLTTKLHVVGPSYVHVTAQLVIARNQDAVTDDLKELIEAALTSLLNPLPSETGEGWPFGRDVFVSEVYEILEKIPGIDFITDVMLDSRCAAGDKNCVEAEPIWHAQGDLVGLRIEDHHLPLFEHADIAIAPNVAFVVVNLLVSATMQPNTDATSVKSAIKRAVRGKFNPLENGPGPGTAVSTDIPLSVVEAAIKGAKGVANASTKVNCIPSTILRTGQNQELFIHVEAGNVIDWHVTIELT